MGNIKFMDFYMMKTVERTTQKIKGKNLNN